MAIGRDVIELQGIVNYKFRDVSYLDTALTHSSYSFEMRNRGMKAESNERLEFLGDAVLEIVISEYLYNNFSNYREGALTKLRQTLVCEKTLAKIAEALSLGDYLNVGNGEESTGCRNRPKVLADALEALFGAVYLDCARFDDRAYVDVIIALFKDEINRASVHTTDYKTALQQLAEQDGAALLEYKVVSEDGPEHNKSFTVVALINNNEVGRGVEKTKKAAEMEAAKKALDLFGVSL